MREPASQERGALADIRVLDFSRVLAGPWCTQILGDMGADVIKIERPVVGDDTRHYGAPYLRDERGDTDQSAYFACCNRNKRSVTLDLATKEGQALARRMAENADVVVENFKVGSLRAYGLDYESLGAINPRLIYCSVTGFGQKGPYAHRAGYDLVAQAMSGIMSINGSPDAEPGGGPRRVGVALMDTFTGTYAATAVLAALQARHRTGHGQHIDMALLDVGVATLANLGSGYLASGKVPIRQGPKHAALTPYQDFETADGALILAVGNDGQFIRFCEAVGRGEWAVDPRYATVVARSLNRDSLLPQIEALLRGRTTEAWVEVLEKTGVPCGPIYNVNQVFDDPHVKLRGLTVRQRRNANDGVRFIDTVSSPLRLSENPPVLRYAPPALGQHTDEVLEEFGVTTDECAKLRAAAII